MPTPLSTQHSALTGKRVLLLLPTTTYRTQAFMDAAQPLGVKVTAGSEEVALEGLLSRGQLRVLALFDKPDPLDGPFFEETIYVTPSRLPPAEQSRIAQCVERACRALGLAEGPVHAELRVNTPITHHSPLSTHQFDGPRVIEVNPRSIGGLCSRVLRFGMGLSLEELIIRHALDTEFVPPARERQAAGVLMIPIPRAGVLNEDCSKDVALRADPLNNSTILTPGGFIMPNMVKIAQTSELSPGTGKVIEAGGHTIALFNVDGTFYAIDNTCTHRGGPLGEGELSDDNVTCPWHGASFNVKTGAVISPPAPTGVRSFAVRVEGTDVLVELD